MNEFEEGEISEVEKTLFLRKESKSNSDEDDDEWDDSQLIKEYDRAVGKAKKQVLAKLQTEMGLTNEDIKEVFSDSNSVKKSKKKRNKKNKPKWDLGSACRAVYSEDGEEYEAEIVQLIEPNSCVVNYIGYNNQEFVSLNDLKPSLGKHAIDMQVMAAMHDHTIVKEIIDEQELNGFFEDHQNKDHKKMPNIGCQQSVMDEKPFKTFKRPLINEQRFPPPPPPLPPVAMGRGELAMDDEALNSMLMSWYMCGYYTGYYQRALKDC